jgi:exodeoxyribonuclease VII large subunit
MQRKEPARIYRVGELNRRIRLKMERWGDVWVEGELSDVSRATSGHVYFTLNDGVEQAQLRGVMFRGDARFARAKLEDGERVRMLGVLSLYEPRGTFQMLARVALTAGEGDRRAELEKLKKKLAAEGLFAAERKRKLPRFPSVIGVVTSREGAALHDVIRVASARAPVRLVVSHCQVQGPEAPISIVRAIRRICRLPGLEVVIVARGGGATEDLFAFNDERVARAIASCPVPVVSGIGHEIDETIADLVADVRAATPSNAAEIVVPDGTALRAEIEASRRRLERALEVRVGRERLRLERLERRLADPRRALAGVRHRFAASRADLERAVETALANERTRLAALTHRLGRLDPRAALARDRAALDCTHPAVPSSAIGAAPSPPRPRA